MQHFLHVQLAPPPRATAGGGDGGGAGGAGRRGGAIAMPPPRRIIENAAWFYPECARTHAHVEGHVTFKTALVKVEEVRVREVRVRSSVQQRRATGTAAAKVDMTRPSGQQVGRSLT